MSRQRQASEESLNLLHQLTVDQAISLMTKGRPLVVKGELVTEPDGSIVYDPPTAAELTAAARILKDNGVDHPYISESRTSAEEEALQGVLNDLHDDEGMVAH